MLPYKFVKRHFKVLYILREVLEWPGALFWDLCEKHWKLNCWFLQDFYKFPEWGKKSRFEYCYNKSWKNYWEHGSLPCDIRNGLRELRTIIGRNLLTKKQKRLLDWFDWCFGCKLLTHRGNSIRVRTRGEITKYYDISCVFGYWKITKTVYTIDGEEGANVFMSSIMALGKSEEELKETTFSEKTDLVYKGFINRKNLYKVLKLYKDSYYKSNVK